MLVSIDHRYLRFSFPLGLRWLALVPYTNYSLVVFSKMSCHLVYLWPWSFSWILAVFTKGTLFWDYSVDSYSGIRITERTEYHFPKEQTLYYSENRIADVTKMKAMRPRKSGYAIFPPKDGRKLPKEHDYRLFCLFRTNRYSVNSAIGSRIDGILFRSFRNQNRSQKNTITANSVYSHSGIVSKVFTCSFLSRGSLVCKMKGTINELTATVVCELILILKSSRWQLFILQGFDEREFCSNICCSVINLINCVSTINMNCADIPQLAAPCLSETSNITYKRFGQTLSIFSDPK